LPSAAVLLTVLTVLTVPTVSFAQDASAILDRATAAFQAVTTLRADFTQSVNDPMIGTNSTSRGEFMQERPSRFSMRWRQPAGDVLLSDGMFLWVYLPSSAPGQVVKAAVTGQPGQSPDVVAEFLERPRDRFNVTFVRTENVGTRPADVLAFTPKQQGGPYRRVLIWVDRQDGLPHQVEITEASGTVRRITFDHLRVNTSIPASAFTFRPPAGTRVVDASRP
jgi:outer membrane lipoprotein carrier protein